MNPFLKGLYLVTLMLLLSYSEAADSIGRYYNEKYPGKCYILPDLILSPGEIAPYPDRDCAIVTCKPNSMGRRQTCGIQVPPPGYKLSEPVAPYEEYPDCCQRQIINA